MLMLWGCSSEVAPNKSRLLGFNYFPLQVGQYSTYDVVDQAYTVLKTTTLRYELKVSVVDTARNVAGQLYYIIHRLKRNPPSQTWTLDSVWTAYKTPFVAVLVENNVPFVKLSFPLQDKKRWDGNSGNALGRENYVLNTRQADTTLHHIQYAHLVKVIQSHANEDVTGFDHRFEIYAPDVGLVVKRSIRLNYCQNRCTNPKQIVSGRDLHMTITAHGKD